MGWIQIEGMEFYAYHGCYYEEQIVGNKFLVDIYIKTNLDKCAESDNIHDAVNYLKVYEVIKEEMQIKSKLLENVAKRIINSVYKNFNNIEKINIKVSKMNPPLGGKIEKVSISLEK